MVIPSAPGKTPAGSLSSRPLSQHTCTNIEVWNSVCVPKLDTAYSHPPFPNLMEKSMSTYRAWYLSLVSSLLVASPWTLQAQSKEPVKMVFAVWHNTTGAEAAVKRMSKPAKDHIEAYAVLTKDSAGKVDTGLRHHRGNSVTGVQASQTVDSAIARLSDTDSAQAYAVSTGATHLSEADLKKVVGMFNPNESALLVVTSKPDAVEITHTLGMGSYGHPKVVQLEVKK